MSQENLEIITRLSEHLRASYAGGAATDGLLAFCAPGIRIDASRHVFNPDVYEGAAGLQRMVGDICDAWEGFEQRDAIDALGLPDDVAAKLSAEQP